MGLIEWVGTLRIQNNSVLGIRDLFRLAILFWFKLFHQLHEQLLQVAKLFAELHCNLPMFLLRRRILLHRVIKFMQNFLLAIRSLVCLNGFNIGRLDFLCGGFEPHWWWWRALGAGHTVGELYIQVQQVYRFNVKGNPWGCTYNTLCH